MRHPAHSSPDHAEAPAKPVNVRKAFYVFGTQILITVMIVTAYYLPWGQTTFNMVFTAALALGQAALVLCFSMHFITEKKFIYGVALFTAIFLSAMLYLILTAGSASGHLHVNHVS
jgi:hypothetical protein